MSGRGRGVSAMMVVVLIAGIGLLVAGLVTVGLGIELDLSFGNTLLLAGAIVACTGVLMLGLWIALRELKAIALQLSGLPAPSRRAGSMLPSAGLSAGDQAPEDGGFVFSHDQPAAEQAGHLEPGGPSPAPPWHEEATTRGRGEVPAPVPVEAPPAAKPRRNLLFSSSSRKERERAEARAAEPSVADLHPETPGPASPAAAPVAESGAAPPATFDDAWPKPERARAPDAPLPRRSGRTPSTFSDAAAGTAAADRVAPAAPSEDQPQVTVLKSGVVDGMAYSLYSDGSIEAQMPEGMMRFASIDELRVHLDQRP
jgi:hypothetical protein